MGEPDQPLAMRRLANVGLAHLSADRVIGSGGALSAELGCLVSRLLVCGKINHQIKPRRSQLKRNPTTNPARRTRNESHLIHARQSLKNKLANEHSKPRLAKRLKTGATTRRTDHVTL